MLGSYREGSKGEKDAGKRKEAGEGGKGWRERKERG